MLRNKQNVLIGLLALVTAAVWIAAALPGEPSLVVAFLDVGDGLCVVVRSPAGKTLVMDCGTASWRQSDTIGEKLVAPYLQSLGVDTIDVAVLSHPHADHVSGYAGLLRAKSAKLVLDIGATHPSPYYREFLEEVKKSGANYRIAKRGQTIDLGGGVVAQVLHPDPNSRYGDLNNRSVVLRIVYRSVAVLLSADAEAAAEREMLDSGLNLQSQILQVGHHGTAEASSPEWLERVQPEVAVISCARRSRYGHPDQETIDRLASVGARTYTTAEHGAVAFSTDGETVRARIFRKSR